MGKIKFTNDCRGIELGDGTTSLASIAGDDGFGAIGFSKLGDGHSVGDVLTGRGDIELFFIISFGNLKSAKVMQKIINKTVESMEPEQ